MNDENFDFCNSWTMNERRSMIESLPEEKRNIQGSFSDENFNQAIANDDLDEAYIELVKSMDAMAELLRHDEYTIVRDFLKSFGVQKK